MTLQKSRTTPSSSTTTPGPRADPSILKNLRLALRPKPRVPLHVAASETLYLSPEYSKETGPVNFDRYPFLVEPLDTLGPDSPTRITVFRGSIQSGKTILGMAAVAALIRDAPGPILWVTATDTLAENFSKKRFDLMVRDSPTLRSLVSPSTSRTKDNTLHLKRFVGGDIKFVGAQSATGLISDTCRYVVIDEADEHKENLSRAGSSIDLSIGRTTTYGDLAKVLIVSSPKVKGDSEIDAWFAKGDQRYFHVPCPRCGETQPLWFRDPETREFRLVWDKGDPSSVHYVCKFCGGEWAESEKNLLLPAGQWVPSRPDIGDGIITSYHLNSLYLPLGGYSWGDLVRQWESAMARLKVGDCDEHRTVINTRLAESYETPGDAIDAHSLSRLVEPDWPVDKIPAGVRTITCGTDVQDDRLETITVGWGLGWECWLLDYNVILSDPRMQDAWTRHDMVIRRTYTTADGRTLRPAASCVDAGFLPQRVLEYTNLRRRWGVYAVRGQDQRGPIWDKKVRRAGKNKTGGTFFAVRTVTAKDDLYAYLKVTAPGPRYVHIPARLVHDHPDLLDQLTSERRVRTRDKKGREVVEWKKVADHRRNEAWDALVYALAAAHSLAIGGLRLDSALPAQPEPVQPPPVIAQPPPLSEPPMEQGKQPTSGNGDSTKRRPPRSGGGSWFSPGKRRNWF